MTISIPSFIAILLFAMSLSGSVCLVLGAMLAAAKRADERTEFDEYLRRRKISS